MNDILPGSEGQGSTVPEAAVPTGSASTAPAEAAHTDSANTLVNGDAIYTDSPADAAAAPEAMQTYDPTTPATDPSHIELLLPDGVHLEEHHADNYRKFCVDCGLTGRQAQQAVDYYMEHQHTMLEAERKTSLMALQHGPWAGKFSEKLAKANYAVDVFDRQMGGRLKPVVNGGLGNNAAFAEMMALVGESLSEDSFSAQHGAYSSAPRAMTTEEFLRKEVFKNQ